MDFWQDQTENLEQRNMNKNFVNSSLLAPKHMNRVTSGSGQARKNKNSENSVNSINRAELLQTTDQS